MRAVANNFAQLGVNQAELDQLENWDSFKLQKLKARIEIIQKSLKELDDSIETLEKIDGSASFEVFSDAQQMSDQTSDEIELINNEVQLLLKQGTKPGTNTHPPHPRQGYEEDEGTPRTERHSEGFPSEQRTLRRGLTPRRSESPESRIGASSPYNHRGAQAKVKFKPLEFPNFSGKRRDFAHFQSIWKNIVEHSGFSKFVLANQLLISCKGGFAHDLIRSVDIDSSEAYDKMWGRLNEYFGDTEALLSSLYRDLEKLKPVTSDSVQQLIHFCNELEYIVQSLNSISPQHVGKVPVNIVDKLARGIPQRLQQEWHRIYFKLPPGRKKNH